MTDVQARSTPLPLRLPYPLAPQASPDGFG